jgi:hypothetical protein
LMANAKPAPTTTAPTAVTATRAMRRGELVIHAHADPIFEPRPCPPTWPVPLVTLLPRPVRYR